MCIAYFQHNIRSYVWILLKHCEKVNIDFELVSVFPVSLH